MAAHGLSRGLLVKLVVAAVFLSGAFAGGVVAASASDDAIFIREEGQDDDLWQPSRPQPNDSLLRFTPAPQYVFQGGAESYGKHGLEHGATGLAVLVFLEDYSMTLQIRGSATMTSNGLAHAGGGLRVRLREPIDPHHKFWYGYGADVEGRYSSVADVDSYFRAHPIALVGMMHAFKKECVIHLFARAGVGIVDTQTGGRGWGWDRLGRPSVGAESFFQCESFRVFAAVQHIFELASWDSTDRGELELSKTWPVYGELEVGIFGKGEAIRESGWESAPGESAHGDVRRIERLHGGLEIRY